MIKKFLKVLFGLSIGAGFFFILGAAGSSDLNQISFSEILKYGGIGLALMWGGTKGIEFVDPAFFN